MLLVLTSILLMTLDHRQQHLQTLRDGLAYVVTPIQFLVNLPVDATLWLSESFSTRQTLLEENAAFKSQHLLLQAKIQKNIALETENRRLRELLGSSLKITDRVLIAELYAVDLDPYRHLVRLNKNRSHGVYVDQPVLDAYGVMGQIVESGPTYSTARLITDPDHVLPVQINRNGLRTIAVGTGTINKLLLPYLPNNADVQEGDLLVTSGLGQTYPPGYPVARITSITRDPGSLFASIVTTPTAHLDRSREVLLVWSTSNREETPAETEPAAGDAAGADAAADTSSEAPQ